MFCKSMKRLVCVTACVSCILTSAELVAEELTLEQEQFFESKIRPVLVRECYGCHSNQTGNARGGLKLDTEQLLHIGGSTGPAVVPGDLEQSLLYSAITYDEFEMPPKRKLSPAVIADFKRWIEMGAPDPRRSEITETKSSITPRDLELARSTFWAYQPVTKPPRPEVDQADWCKGEVDAFVLAALETNELSPSADAEPHQVLRRLCFDIVGLPPTIEQIDAFERMWKVDPQRAVEHVVDRLLESEQYGERWGRHWLDVARYAESTGREVNVTYPHAWRYRDFVIDSFNEDKPFDEFVKQQIAGDLLPVETDQQWAENLIATTFLAVGAKNVNEQNRVQFAADLVDEQIDATTRVFLGMSVACARCHDHKFDAIPQSDYYALAGLFDGMTTYYGNPPSELGTFSPAQRKRNSSLIRLPVDDPNPYDRRYTRRELEELKEEIQSTIAGFGQRSSARGGNANALKQRLATLNRLSDLTAKLAVVDENGQPISYCMGVQQPQEPQDVRLLVRGEIDQPSQVVPRGVPSVIGGRDSGGMQDRKDLANWITSSDNPLTARVMVNRIWQHLIGAGIVSSTENFGVTGQTPSHPELLDYLASEFVASGWSIKHVVRLIATSRIYRTASTHDEDNHQVDPDNRLLWRANVRRLEAEALRDAMLRVAGKLDLERPRGSEVARAGFTTMRQGVLGDPREKVQQAVSEIADQVRAQARDRRSLRGARGRMTPQQRQEMIAEATRKISNQLDMEDATFRSVYLPIVRNEVPRSLEVFDFAAADTITGQRETSQTSNQALYMMNNPLVIDCSNSFAQRLEATAGKPVDQLNLAFNLAFARSPTRTERSLATRFLRDYVQHDGELTVTAALCQSLFAAAEFRLIE
ncbi:MAG: hypothetical protein Aurels2KO_15820 [Aureliella sp.]